MADLPKDVEEAVRRVEEFRATAAPEQQSELERTRANIQGEMQNSAEQRQREEVARQVEGDYPALAQALRTNTNLDAEFPAIRGALDSIRELESLERQRQEIEERIASLRASSEANLAGANAVLEVRARQSRENQRDSGNKTENNS